LRYTPDHKRETRGRIIASAARRFRDEGYGSASVADIMSEAGLTHGGFYAHFGSKEELLVEAIAHAADEALSARTPVGEQRGPEWLESFVALYLNEQHRADRAGGCPLAALGGDVARGGDLPRASYGAAVASFADALASRLDGPEQWRQETAQTVMSMCVGALVLARAGLDHREAQTLFAACRRTAARLGEARSWQDSTEH
jgi:TetR/AcrR family transcriptional regulator, transcriptional repressor for nem operon